MTSLISCNNNEKSECIHFIPVYLNDAKNPITQFNQTKEDKRILSNIMKRYNFKYKSINGEIYYCEKDSEIRQDMIIKISSLYSDSLKLYHGDKAKFNFYDLSK